MTLNGTSDVSSVEEEIYTTFPVESKTLYPGLASAHFLALARILYAPFCDLESSQVLRTRYSQEMEDCADGYRAFVMEEVAKARERCADPLVLVEQRLDYTNYINGRDDWELVEVYTDEGITGTNTKHREGFKRMVSDALAGKIDLTMWRETTKPSFPQKYSRWFSKKWSGATSVADEAVSTFSPAKSAVANAEAGTAPKPGTPMISTKRPSGSAITNLMATTNAPHLTLLMRIFTATLFRQSTSFLLRRMPSLHP